MSYRINPLHVLIALCVTAVGLTLLGLWAIIDTRMATLFNMNSEASVPTWYSVCLLLIAALVAGLIAHMEMSSRSQLRYHWVVLALTFVLLSIDECASIHERLGERLGDRLAMQTVGVPEGPLFYSWIIGGIVFVGVFAIAFIPFLRRLPRHTGLLMVSAGVIFVGGAIGIETFNGISHDALGTESLRYRLGTAAEEFLEILGVSVFIYALLKYLEQRTGGGLCLTLRIVGDPPAEMPLEQDCPKGDRRSAAALD